MAGGNYLEASYLKSNLWAGVNLLLLEIFLSPCDTASFLCLSLCVPTTQAPESEEP